MQNHTNVSDAIYPPEDYRGYAEQAVEGDYELPTTPEGPPLLYVDALPVKLVAADRSSIFTVPVMSTGNAQDTVLTPTRILNQSPNNLRRRVLINVLTQAACLLASPDPVTIRVVSGIFTIPGGLHLPVNTYLELTTAGELYAVGRGAASTFSMINCIVDEYEQSPL